MQPAPLRCALPSHERTEQVRRTTRQRIFVQRDGWPQATPSRLLTTVSRRPAVPSPRPTDARSTRPGNLFSRDPARAAALRVAVAREGGKPGRVPGRRPEHLGLGSACDRARAGARRGAVVAQGEAAWVSLTSRCPRVDRPNEHASYERNEDFYGYRRPAGVRRLRRSGDLRAGAGRGHRGPWVQARALGAGRRYMH
jgi:hypothetical protein